MRIDSYSLKIKKSFTGAAFQIWLLTSVFLTVFLSLYMFYVQDYVEGLLVFAFFIASFICSAPAFIILMIVVPIINKSPVTYNNKIGRLLVLQLFISIMYGIIAGPIFTFFLPSYKYIHTNVFVAIIGASLILFCCSLLAGLITLVNVARYFSPAHTFFSYSSILLQFFNLNNQKTTIMETPTIETAAPSSSPSNRILIKGVITGTLILLLLIPAYYITNLVTERQERQKEVVKEVSSKWATEQTLSGPYLVLPYINSYTNDTGKLISVKTNLILFADNLRVNGELIPEKRQRSIYKVLLYKSTLAVSGLFKPQWPVEINITNIDFAGAKLCFGLSDFKGLEEEIKITFNNQPYVLSPGLPITDVSEKGLSVPVSLQGDTFNNALSFNFSLKLRGSERLHFLPLAANSKFQIRSAWPNPSFDGNVLPNDREVNNKGFTATWNFNRANLPFNMIEKQGKFNDDNLSFGVSMVQPADQYEKTMRSVKYALLFIGLTFSFFFIIELLQKRPFHPVQYVLVGLALLIFYTLLLSVSEFILFDYAYFLAAAATILLISLYAKSHFAKWSIASVFAAALTCLYSFIFVLIRLEDTALLLGSIGLFIVLAIVMYLSRRIKWYGAAYQTA